MLKRIIKIDIMKNSKVVPYEDYSYFGRNIELEHFHDEVRNDITFFV